MTEPDHESTVTDIRHALAAFAGGAGCCGGTAPQYLGDGNEGHLSGYLRVVEAVIAANLASTAAWRADPARGPVAPQAIDLEVEASEDEMEPGQPGDYYHRQRCTLLRLSYGGGRTEYRLCVRFHGELIADWDTGAGLTPIGLAALASEDGWGDDLPHRLYQRERAGYEAALASGWTQLPNATPPRRHTLAEIRAMADEFGRSLLAP